MDATGQRFPIRRTGDSFRAPGGIFLRQREHLRMQSTWWKRLAVISMLAAGAAFAQTGGSKSGGTSGTSGTGTTGSGSAGAGSGDMGYGGGGDAGTHGKTKKSAPGSTDSSSTTPAK